jgi:hypothetical protein
VRPRSLRCDTSAIQGAPTITVFLMAAGYCQTERSHRTKGESACFQSIEATYTR